MGLGDKIAEKFHERAERKREESERKRDIDRQARKIEQTEYYKNYRSNKYEEAKQRGAQRAKGRSFNLGGSPISSERVRGAGNAASSGLKFLGGDLGFGAVGGSSTDISNNLQDLIGFGGSSKASKPVGLKPKRTTISTGGKRITITDNSAMEGQPLHKKKEKTVFENLEDLMSKDFDF